MAAYEVGPVVPGAVVAVAAFGLGQGRGKMPQGGWLGEKGIRQGERSGWLAG